MSCAVCGGQLERAFEAYDINRRISDRSFHYARCSDCRTYQLLDVPCDLDAYYTTAYYGDIGQLGSGEYARQQLVCIPPQLSGRLIDVGPAMGGLLRAANGRFADRAAVERDPECCATLRADGVETVETEDPVAGVLALAPADVVTMFHLIEHVPDPMSLLDAAATRVKPGGALVVATPNPQAFSFRVCGAWWVHLEAPRHLFLLPLRVIARRLEQSGLRMSSVTTRDRNGLHLDANAWGHWATHVARNPRASYYLRATMRHLALPIERLPLRGSTYTAVFSRS